MRQDKSFLGEMQEVCSWRSRANACHGRWSDRRNRSCWCERRLCGWISLCDG